MKILHIVSSVHKAGGGTSEVVPRLCRALQESGNSVTLAVVDFGQVSDTAEDAKRAGVRILQFSADRHLKSLALSESMKFGLRGLIEESDIVHLHGLWQAPCWYAAAECRRQHKPYVMMPHGFLEPERLKISKWKKRIVGALFDRRYLKSANALVATAPSEAEGFRQYGLTNPVHIMPIGLDLERFELGVGHGCRSTTKKRLLYFSRVTPIKGLDMLAEAWKRLERFHNGWGLVVAGPDDRGYTNEIRPVFERLSPDGSVTFTGPVYGDAKFAMLRSADAFILPTRSENWSIAVAEAMATGLPVVCTKGAPWSCINECGAGYWVDISVDAITAGLEKVLSAPGEDRNKMGLAGRKWVEGNLAWPKIAKDMEAFYANIR